MAAAMVVSPKMSPQEILLVEVVAVDPRPSPPIHSHRVMKGRLSRYVTVCSIATLFQ